MRKLKVIAGKDRDMGREFSLPLQGEVILGRALDTVTKFVDTLVSGKHCQIEVNGDSVYLMDRNSSNGTFIGPDEANLSRVEPNKRIELSDGLRIRLGNDTILQYIDDSVHNLRTQRAPEDLLRQLRAATAQTRVEPDETRPRQGGLASLPATNSPLPSLPATPPATPPAQGMGQGSSGNMPSLPSGTGMGSRQLPGTVSVNCSYCTQQLVAKEQYAGMQVRCPNCRNMVTLPSGRGPGTTPPGAPSTALPPPTPPNAYPSVGMPPPPQPPLPAPPAQPAPPSFSPFPAQGSSGNMSAFPGGGGSSMLPGTLPPMGMPPGMPSGMPGMMPPNMPPGMAPPPASLYPQAMPGGGLLPPSLDAFQLPMPEPPRRGLRPIHLIMMTLPVVILVVAVVVVVKMILS